MPQARAAARERWITRTCTYCQHLSCIECPVAKRPWGPDAPRAGNSALLSDRASWRATLPVRHCHIDLPALACRGPVAHLRQPASTMQALESLQPSPRVVAAVVVLRLLPTEHPGVIQSLISQSQQRAVLTAHLPRAVLSPAHRGFPLRADGNQQYSSPEFLSALGVHGDP
jgi:hypothetical protein